MAEVGRCAEARRGCCWRALVMRKIGRLLSAAIFPNMQERLGGFGDPSLGAPRLFGWSVIRRLSAAGAFSFAGALYRNPKI